MSLAESSVAKHSSPAKVELESVDCPICGPCDRAKFAVSDGYQVVRCRQCSLMFVDPRRSRRAVAQYYREEYIPDQQYAETHMISYRHSSLRREAACLRRWLPTGGRLVDVGASSGTFLREFAAHPQWQVEGVELSKVAAGYAREKFGLTMHEGFLAEQRFPDAQFDVVTSLDVFMMHPDPNEDLAEMRRILKPGGLLAMEIPGLTFRLWKNSGPLCRLLYGVPAHLNPSNHLYLYSRRTLSQLLAQHGFDIVAWYPERAPVYGNVLSLAAKWAYYQASALLYNATRGLVNVAPKEFLLYQKRVS